MVGEDRVVMTGNELRRVPVIRQALEKKLTQVKAATVLGLTPRQVRRLMTRVRQEATPGWCIGGAASRRTGGSPRRSRRRSCGCTRRGMETLGRPWPRRSRPSGRD